MHLRLILLLIGLLLHSAAALSQECNQPTVECLHKHIKLEIGHIQQNGLSLRPSTRQEWEYENQRQYNSPATHDNSSTLINQLLHEEHIIKMIDNGQLKEAYLQSKTLVEPFHDILGAQGKHLVIQHLTLALKDDRAEQIKRELLESTWQHNRPPNAELIEIARHEILGGDPHKGIITLGNTQINEFSDITLLNEQSSVQQLATTAESLFLNPSAAKKNCEQDASLALANIRQYFSTSHIKIVQSLWNTPDIQQAWKAQLSLAILYRNAGACELLISLHLKQLINSALRYRAQSDQDIANMIFLLRAIRRYYI